MIRKDGVKEEGLRDKGIGIKSSKWHTVLGSRYSLRLPVGLEIFAGMVGRYFNFTDPARKTSIF